MPLPRSVSIDVPRGPAAAAAAAEESMGASAPAVGSRSSAMGGNFASLKVPTKVMIDFCQQVAMRLSAGIPLLKVLQVLADTEPHAKFQAYLRRIYSGVVEGRGLAASMATAPTPFTAAHLSMIEAGTQAGSDFLPRVFDKLCESFEVGQELRREISGALRYPMIVGFIALAIMIGMLLKVVPNFAQIFKDTGAKLPKATEFLVAMSDFVRQHWLTTLVIVAVVLVVLRVAWLVIRQQRFFQSLLLGIPALGEFLRAHMRAQFFSVMGQLLAAGVPLQKALAISVNVHTFYHYRNAVEGFITGVTSGQNLSDCMLNSDIFGQRAAQLVATGEKSGGLGEIMQKVGGRLEQELLYRLRAVVKFVEPLSVMSLALLVGAMVAALFLPLFSLAMAFK